CDNQVKIRGYRIEPGEIEQQLAAYDKIKETVVTVWEDENKNLSLCAYFTAPEEITAEQLKQYLTKRLPAYMIPAYFIPLEKIPLNRNGKVNRKALPEPGKASLKSTGEYKAPQNEQESKMVAVWEKVLGVETISTDDNFFMIGGDSIKTIQIIARMKRLGYELQMRDIFRNPTISALAPYVKIIQRQADQSVIAGTIPLTPIQKRYFAGAAIDRHHYNQSIMLYSKERLEEEAVQAVFKKILLHHDALRMTFNEKEGETIQNNHGPEYPFSMEKYDLRGKEKAVVHLEENANRLQGSINLEKGPLLKTALFRLDDGDRLLIILHHLVIDGISWRILLEDLEDLFQQLKTDRNKPLKLPLKTDSFKAWAEALYRYAAGENLRQEKTYWKQLEAAAGTLIKKDFQEENNRVEDTETITFSITEKETRQLLTEVNQAFGTEINDILLTAVARAVKLNWGESRLLVAMEGHEREKIAKEIDISRTIGWFTTVYPILLELSGNEKKQA
ncbi:MAG: non-ribosomal peptide synthetase, partial [bacterium]|nr:non-ribosomal peptide synthetase [bacterium]